MMQVSCPICKEAFFPTGFGIKCAVCIINKRYRKNGKVVTPPITMPWVTITESQTNNNTGCDDRAPITARKGKTTALAGRKKSE